MSSGDSRQRTAPAPRRIGSPNWIGLFALYRRELRRALGYWMESLVAPAAQAALFYAAFSMALGDARETADGRATLDFLVPGLVIFITMIQAFELPAVSFVYTKYDGTIVDTLMAPLSALEMLLGHVLAGMSNGLIAGGLGLLSLLLLHGVPAAMPVSMLLFAVGAAFVAALVGTLSGILCDTWDHFASVYTFGVIPALFLSGVFAPLDDMPMPVRAVLTALPPHHALDGFRKAAVGEPGGLLLSLLVLACYALLIGAVTQLLLQRGTKLKS